MHECSICGMACDCDCEDMENECPDYCICDHEGSGFDEDGNPIDDEEDDDSDAEFHARRDEGLI